MSNSITIEYTDGRSKERTSKEFDNESKAKKFFATKKRERRNPKLIAGSLSRKREKKREGLTDHLKPYPEFPLYAHALGYWSKKINGKLHHFGRWGRMVDGEVTYTDLRDIKKLLRSTRAKYIDSAPGT